MSVVTTHIHFYRTDNQVFPVDVMTDKERPLRVYRNY